MHLVDADLLRDVIEQMRPRITTRETDEYWQKYWKAEFEIYRSALYAIREASPPELVVLQAEREGWTPCSEGLPEVGANVILTFRDTFHTHPSWPKVAVMPAWICNVSEEKPRGEWAIEGRLGNYIVDIDSGIAWMPMPAAYQAKN